MKLHACRKCGTLKMAGDICPGVNCIRKDQPMRTHKSMPIGLSAGHGFHAIASVSRAVATASLR